MAQLVKQINAHTRVEFDKGTFDNWCVYLHRGSGWRYAPRDTEYFSALQRLGKTHGAGKIYEDFVQYYGPTSHIVDSSILHLITTLSAGYNSDALEIEVWFTVIYAGMVAEENKANAILKKRIKRLGMHQVLVEGLDVNYAANFSKGKKWKELDLLMQQKGF